jgi:hypothetical protein
MSRDAISIINEMPEPCLNKFNNRIYEIITKDSASFRDRPCLHFSDNAKMKFDKFQKRINDVIQKIRCPMKLRFSIAGWFSMRPE